MFQNSNYSCVHLSDVLNQYYVPEKIDKPELESYITLSSYGKGIKKREIKEGKTPVPFTGCRIKAGQFISSRLHAKEGAFGLVPEELDGFVVSRDFPVFDIDINQINPKYLLAAVSHESFYQQFLNDSFGSTTKRRIKENIFLEYSIVLPPLDKQNEYVSFLEHIGHIRTMLKRYLYLLDSLVKSRFIEMFGTDVNPKYGHIKVGEVVSKKIGRVSKQFSTDSIIQYIDIASIDKDSKRILSTTEYVVSEAPSRAQQCVEEGDILLSNVRPNLRTISIVHLSGSNLVCSTGFSVLRCELYLPEYFLMAISSDSFTEHLMSKATGSSYPAVTTKDVMNQTIPAAPLELQKKFSDFVRQVDKSKFEVVQSLLKLKDSMKSSQ